MSNEPLLCSECNEPIDRSAIYFWGRDGGQWHARCRARRDMAGNAARGMWIPGNSFDLPTEYILEVRGLHAGAGI